MLTDIACMEKIQEFTINSNLIEMSNYIKDKILYNRPFTALDKDLFYSITYLLYLITFFPLHNTTADEVMEEYNWLFPSNFTNNL